MLLWPGDFNNNLITNNYIHSNVEEGIYIGYGNYDNLIYHNHFEANNNASNVFDSNHTQAIDFSTNFWDNGYPEGGNYWSDWLSPDSLNGPAQDLAGADGIVDFPYELDINTNDTYPLTKSPLAPQGPPIATIDIDPDTLNLKSKGKWITCYIELPSGYDPRYINASTILLNGTIPPELNTKYGFVKSGDGYIMDHDGDGIEERMIKFNRSAVQEMIGAPNPSVELIVTGELYDGTPFEGSDVIRAIHEP
jgi:hypothetical protein